MKLPIYLDYMATTPVDPRVKTAMMSCLSLEDNFGNPASTSHIYGWKAAEAVSNARNEVAQLINADPKAIVFTSGATEANNMAIKGAANFYRRKGKHLVTCQTEHKAVLDVCQFLTSKGCEVTYLPVQQNGLIALNELKNALRDDTVLVSIMHVNNEIGVIQDIENIAKIVHKHGALLHVDAAQSVGKIPVDVEKLDADYLSMSAHKMYGPKGAGALYIHRRPQRRVEPLIHGGGHERGLRSGTLATHQIVGFGEAARIAKQEMQNDNQRIEQLSHQLWQGIRDLNNITLNGDHTQRVPHNLNVTFADIEGEQLLINLRDIAVSSGSACASTELNPSHVLLALGLTQELAHSTLRISLGKFTTEEEIDYAIKHIVETVQRLL